MAVNLPVWFLLCKYTVFLLLFFQIQFYIYFLCITQYYSILYYIIESNIFSDYMAVKLQVWFLLCKCNVYLFLIYNLKKMYY